MRPCYRYEERICVEEGKGVFIVKRKERRGMQVYKGTVEEGLYQTFEVISNSTGVFCRKERWEKEDGTRLLIPQ